MANEEKDNNEEKDSVPQPEQVPTAESGPVEATVARMEMVADQTAAEEEEDPALVRAAYEHPLPIRITHWVNAISLFVMVTSGLRIFRAFPSFGPKIPEKVLLTIPRYITLGGWLGGALQWHFTFMWFFVASGVLYVAYQVFSGHYRTMLFLPRDVAGVWPMARHYFFFGPKPAAAGQYNPLQKLAYTSTIGFGV
ncbi:MAG: cytochrome b/b6 domain-containing protein, partial [Terriglobales bacterium]